jgi:beta-N-acetylhexosaminidase
MRGIAIVAAATAAVVGVAPAAYAGTQSHDPIDAQVRAVMAKMTLPEKVGQMFVSYVYGDSATTTNAADVASNHTMYGADVDNGAEVLAKYHLGGVIYFTWSNNLNNPQQITDLSNGLQQAAGSIPLQISTDQEGGVVTRIGAPVAVSPGNMAIGATFNPLDAYRTAQVSGAELRSLGINVDDAPVVDVNTNPRNSADGARSFGDNTAQVSLFAASAVAGFQAGGVAAQAKHFPGLGDTTVNTDNGVAVTNETRQQIMDTDVPPFRAAIAAGTKSIMAAHIVAPALDPSGRPASLSKPIITGLLRNTLHYNGVVITDSLAAAALADIPADQIVLDAVDAGIDELLMPTSPPAAIQTLLDAVHNGTVSEARIDQSVYRILRLKAELGLFKNRTSTGPAVGSPEHQQTMADAAQRSITVLRKGALPLKAGQKVLLTGWGSSSGQTLYNDLLARGQTVQRLYTGSPNATVIAQAVAAAQASDVTVVTTGNAWNDATQVNLVNALLATGKPVIVAAVSGPYDIAYFPTAPSYVASYGYQPVSLAALADVLTGKTKATGHLPVTIRTPDGASVLFHWGS